MNETLTKVGLIGAGKINSVHAQILSEQPNVELVAVADLNEEQGRELANEYRIKWWADYEKLAMHPSIDAVWVATPPSSHRKICMELLEAGKHVMVEKPISLSLKEADEMIACAQKNEVKLSVGFQKRHALSFRKCKEIIESGEMGNLMWCLGYYIGIPHLWWRSNWCWDVNEGGGLVVENTCHYIDMIRWLVGREITQVYASLAQSYQAKSTVEDTGVIVLKFDSGTIATIKCGMNVSESFPHEKLMLGGTQGEISASANMLNLPVEGSKLSLYKFNIPYVQTWHFTSSGYKEQDISFIECIQKDLSPVVTGDEARAVLEVSLAALLSSKQNKPIKIPLQEDIGIKDILPLPWSK